MDFTEALDKAGSEFKEQIDKDIYHSQEWIGKRKEFLTGKVICEYCGKQVAKLIVHHHTLNRYDPGYMDFKDCAAICSKCHYGLFKGYMNCLDCNKQFRLTGHPRPMGRYCESTLRAAHSVITQKYHHAKEWTYQKEGAVLWKIHGAIVQSKDALIVVCIIAIIISFVIRGMVE